MQRFATVFLLTNVTGILLAGGPSPALEPAEVVDIEQTIFTSGGLLELKDSFGDVEIVGWDQPEIEVMVTKSTNKRYAAADIEKASAGLDRILVATKQVADDHVVIRTEFPSRSIMRPLGGRSNVHLAYRIHVPRQTRLLVKQDMGELKITDVRANMMLSNAFGRIELNLPETERYSIDARARIGGVNSEWCSGAYPGLTNDGIQPHRLEVRVGVGDITVKKSRVDTDSEVD